MAPGDVYRRRHRAVFASRLKTWPVKRREASKLGILKATTVHQESGCARALNVAVRKKFLPTNPCSGVNFQYRSWLFRPHYVTWSESSK